VKVTNPKTSKRARVNPITQSILRSHYHVFVETSRRIFSSPISTLMTVLVIAIALLLPALLQIVSNNLEHFSGQFEESAQITLYLHDSINEIDALRVSEDLLLDEKISNTVFISKTEALAEFSNSSGFGATINELSDNPLPASIVVYPVASTIEDTRALYLELQQLGEVEVAQFDLRRF
jgi:cell division transport system permease protein